MSKELNSFAQAVAEALVRSKVSEVEVDTAIIGLKEGETIEGVMTARGFKPVGDVCKTCGVQHEWKSKDGDTAFIADEDNLHAEGPKEAPAPKDQAARQAKALASLDKRIAEVREALDLLDKLRASIARPIDKREFIDMLEEISLAMAAKDLLSGGL